ncbi:DUF5991 domain-containing protein [Chitinophaga sp. HK235]|uniref:DUF5991 domain-containing protein n=1 Tax=Chitinophaga sp. HK235 TaxID=2952571 RepID=UPI0035B37B69
MQMRFKIITVLYFFIFLTGCNSIAQSSNLSRWSGIYKFSVMTDEIRGGIEVGTDYKINITRDSCLFTANGIQYAFSDKCYIKANKDTLMGYFCYDTDGFVSYHECSVPLFKIFKKADQYYIISSAILEDTSKAYVLKRTP